MLCRNCNSPLANSKLALVMAMAMMMMMAMAMAMMKMMTMMMATRAMVMMMMMMMMMMMAMIMAQVSLIQPMVRVRSFVLMAGLEGSPFRPPAMPRRQWGTHSQTRLSTPNCDSKHCCCVLSHLGRSPLAFNCDCPRPRDHMPQSSGTRWPQQR